MKPLASYGSSWGVCAGLVQVTKAASTQELLSRPCCGSGCENCPYDPPHQKGNTKVRDGVKSGSALGIPDRSNYGDISRIQPGELLDLIVQKHQAERAGEHFDVRIGDADKGLFSWATRKGLPDAPGTPVQLFQQPLHSHDYGGFEGEITEGYGKGKVSKVRGERVLVTKTNGGISITTPKGERLRLTKQDGQWIATKGKQLPLPRHQKTSMPVVKPENVANEEILTAEPKIDGALHIMSLAGGKPELMSHRQSKRHGGPIIHTERVFGRRPEIDPAKIPQELRDSELLGEVYGVGPDGKVISPEELGGLLNSDIDKSLAKQREKKIRMKLALHGIAGSTKSREEQRQLLAQAAALLPDDLEVTPEVKGREEALRLLEEIKAGKNALTHEGIIIHTPSGPKKVPLFDEKDVYIRGTYPGSNRLAVLGGTGVSGGFTYSFDPEGPIVGRVGSGLNDETRAALTDYIGRVARVRHRGQGAGGALKKPSFIALHEDYPGR